jgi:hypothetical protein
MNKLYSRIGLLLCLAWAASGVFAQGVELNPAYLTGRLNVSNGAYADHVASLYVYASYYDSSAGTTISANTSGNPDGTYTLTLNAPADGSARTYDLQVGGYLKNGFQYLITADTLTVQKNQTYSRDFTLGIATLKVRISADNGLISSWYAYWSPYEYPSKSYSPGASSVEENFEIPANQDLSWVWGSVSPSDTVNFGAYSLPSQSLAGVAPGATAVATWSIHFPPVVVVQTGTISGNIAISGIPSGFHLSYHWPVIGNFDPFIYSEGPFSYPSMPVGNYSPSWFQSSYYKNNADGTSQSMSMQWPLSWLIPGYPNPDHFTLTAGGNYVMDIVQTAYLAEVAMNVTGTVATSDLTGSNARLYTISGSDGNPYTYGYSGGNAQSVLVAGAAGDYRLYYGFQINKTAADGTFYNCGFDYYPSQTSAGQVTLSAAGTASVSADLPTGTVTIKFSSTDGSLVASPYISGSASIADPADNLSGSANITAYGPSTALAENSVTFVGMPGTYTLNASAYVNGSNVTFSPKTVIVIEGVHTVLEINGPSLTVNSPIPETYTTDAQATVAGTADDDSGVASVTVNGGPVTLASTGDPSRPNEVSFNTTIPLANGVNKIVVEALDTAGKQALDTRFVYRDKGAPTLSFTPASGTSTPSGTVTVNGLASDDNGIAKIQVDGQGVAFASSGNPSDPNEVAFSFDVDLNDGPNTISVVATDICKRVTSEAHVVTKADQDLTPPVFPALADLTLEQASPLGTAYSLPIPVVTDDRDPAPVVTSDAPAIFPAGTTLVTWTAADASGNKATATQSVLVRDTTPPAIQALSDALVAQAGPAGTPFVLPKPTATDAADPAPIVSSNAPAIFPPGSTIVTWTATDASGNSSQATQEVTVRDMTPPVLSAVGNLVLEQASAAGTPNTLVPPTAFDAVDPAPAVSSNAPAIFPAGTTAVTWTATDASGNSAQEIQTVLVRDTTPPVFPALATVNLVQSGPGGTPYVLPVPAVTDAVDPKPAVSSNAPAVFPVGATTVTWTAKDAAGNASTAAQSVIVKASASAPVLCVEPSFRLLPNNGALIPIWVWLKATDAVDGNLTREIQLVSVTSDEPRGLRSPDIIILGRNLILLRGEADRNGNGRVYTLTYQVANKAGVVTKASKTVEVRKQPWVPVIDSGAAYAVTPDKSMGHHDSDGDGRYRDDRFDNGRHKDDRQDGDRDRDRDGKSGNDRDEGGRR